MTDEQKAKIEANPNYNKAAGIVRKLDEYGRECDKYEYGLPMYADREYEMIELVLNILSN